MYFNQYFSGRTLGNIATGPGSSESIKFDQVACTGTELSLFACPRLTGAHDCVHSEDVSVRCSSGECDLDYLLKMMSCELVFLFNIVLLLK